MSKGRVQKSKQARQEEKEIRQLQSMGIKVGIKHRTSHCSGGRGKAR